MKLSLGLFLMMVSVPLGFARAATLVEDFSTANYADPANSTGVWNALNHSARAQAFANADATRPIDFGNGSDGVVNSANGFTFDTDSHPNGYQFQSLSITGGSITVTGSRPLVIRSLTSITVTPPIRVNGPDGGDGNSNGLSITGPSVATCLAKGGNGGSATTGVGSNGGDGVFSDGSTDTATHGTGQTNGAYNGSVDAIATSFFTPNYDFDNNRSVDFVCGVSGAGGGGYTNGASFASGGAGGAGGGLLQIVAVGDINVGATEAKGGHGGNGATVAAGPICSGYGSGGIGGVVFFQTLSGLYTGSDPNVAGGASGTSACNGTGNGQMLDGLVRSDMSTAGHHPTWAVTALTTYPTDTVPANLQSYVQSKSYDLKVLNASFDTATIASTGSVTMTYAGSADGVNFSRFTDLQSLNNQGYRYLKFRANFTNGASAGAPPQITNLTISYSDLGLASVNSKIFAGCGTLALTRGKSHSNSDDDRNGALFTLVALSLIYGISKLRLGTKAQSELVS